VSPTRRSRAELAGGIDAAPERRGGEHLAGAGVPEETLGSAAVSPSGRTRAARSVAPASAERADVHRHAQLRRRVGHGELPLDRERGLHRALRELLERAGDAERRGEAGR
jgi:hypothetical protein